MLGVRSSGQGLLLVCLIPLHPAKEYSAASPECKLIMTMACDYCSRCVWEIIDYEFFLYILNDCWAKLDDRCIFCEI